MNRHFETIVVGAGPAGIAAAVSAGEAARHDHDAASVALVDDNPAPGGQIWRGPMASRANYGRAEGLWRSRLLAAPIALLQGWSVFDRPAPGRLRAGRNGKIADLHYDKLILATGARERFLPFPGWTLPNVMGVGALQAMVKSGLPVEGKRIVIAGSGPLLLAVAASLKAAGANVLYICEQAGLAGLIPFALSLVASPGKVREGLRYKAATITVPYHTSSWPLAALGDRELRSVVLSLRGKTMSVECDYLACGFHLAPNIELPAMLGCRIENGSVAIDQWQQTSESAIYCAGEPTGIGGLELSLVEGQIAGLSAAGRTEHARRLFRERGSHRRFAARLEKAFALRPELKEIAKDDTLLCRCEDVAYGAVRSHHSWRSAKLHTRCGMGPCQGRVCGAAAEFLLGWGADSYRPPILPSLLGSLAARPANLATETGACASDTTFTHPEFLKETTL